MANVFINLEPRYTPGSPGAVHDEELAQRVARDEQEAYKHALEGVYGSEEKQKAKDRGLELIVFSMHETAKGWRVEDYITGDKHFWPFKGMCRVCGARSVDAKRGKLVEHYSRGTSYMCRLGQGSYVGRLRTEENP